MSEQKIVFKIREQKPEPEKPKVIEFWLEECEDGFDVMGGCGMTILRIKPNQPIQRVRYASNCGIPTNADGQVLIEGLEEKEAE